MIRFWCPIVKEEGVERVNGPVESVIEIIRKCGDCNGKGRCTRFNLELL